MSKSKESKQLSSYSVARKDSGYYINKHVVKDDKVIESVQVTEPDVLIITISKLEQLFRKDLGL